MIFVQVTSKQRNDEFSFPLNVGDLAIPFPPEFNKTCQARCHRISAIDKNKITKKLARLKPAKLEELIDRVVALLKHEG